MRAWFIQSVDLEKFNASELPYVTYVEDIGLPTQESVKFSNIKQLFNSANNAYEEYRKRNPNRHIMSCEFPCKPSDHCRDLRRKHFLEKATILIWFKCQSL